MIPATIVAGISCSRPLMRAIGRQWAAGYMIRIVAQSGKQARMPLSSVRPTRSGHQEAPWEPQVRLQIVGEWCSRDPRAQCCQ